MNTIQLTPEIEDLIAQQIKTGKYQDDLAVIQEGLRLLAERDRIYRGRFEELKREVMIGVEELRRQEGINGEEVFSELEEDLQQIEAKAFPMSQK
jgi:antitoxin ParD1/3/4